MSTRRTIKRHLFKGLCLSFLLTVGVNAATAQDEDGSSNGAAPSPSELEARSEEEKATAARLAQEAAALRLEAMDLKVQSVGLARKIRESENEISQAKARLRELEILALAKATALSNTQRAQFQTLAAIQKLALTPEQSLVLREGQAMAVLRGGFLLRGLLPSLEARRNALEREGLLLAKLTEGLRLARAKHQEQVLAYQRHRRDLDRLIEEKTERGEQTLAALSDYAERARRLAREAQDLRQLMAKVEADRLAQAQAAAEAAEAAAATQALPEPPRTKPLIAQTETSGAQNDAGTAVTTLVPDTTEEEIFEESVILGEPSQVASLPLRAFDPRADQLILPIAGTIKARFGQSLGVDHPYGEESLGLLIRGQPEAVVLAPYDGQVVYAGPFRTFGLILIIDQGGSYHSLLAGLGRIDVVEGQSVLAGEPLGISARNFNYSDLYLELRKAGEPVDPLPWIAMTGEKERG